LFNVLKQPTRIDNKNHHQIQLRVWPTVSL